MENPASEPPQQSCEDVRKSGYLRKQKSMHRRYFVLRTASERGAARLEYYESEKKFRGKAPIPKKALVLETCFNINKRADSKNKHMIVLYTRAESFAIAAENEADQDEWYQAMVDLQCKSKRNRRRARGQTHARERTHTHTLTCFCKRTWQCRGLRQSGCISGHVGDELSVGTLLLSNYLFANYRQVYIAKCLPVYEGSVHCAWTLLTLK